MFLIDDLMLRSLGISMPPGLDMIGTIEQIQKQAYKEMYNPEKIRARSRRTGCSTNSESWSERSTSERMQS